MWMEQNIVMFAVEATSCESSMHSQSMQCGLTSVIMLVIISSEPATTLRPGSSVTAIMVDTTIGYHSRTPTTGATSRVLTLAVALVWRIIVIHITIWIYNVNKKRIQTGMPLTNYNSMVVTVKPFTSTLEIWESPVVQLIHCNYVQVWCQPIG